MAGGLHPYLEELRDNTVKGPDFNYRKGVAKDILEERLTKNLGPGFWRETPGYAKPKSRLSPISEPLSGNVAEGKEPSMKVVKEVSVTSLPQGSPLSPLLSVMLLGEVNSMFELSVPKAPNFICYADDGLIYSD